MGANGGGPTETERRERLVNIWKDSNGNRERVASYIEYRGLPREVLDSIAPDALRFHPALPYFDPDGNHRGNFPAMVAKVTDVDGKGVSLHKTYLSPDGPGKLDLGDGLVAKKLMPAVSDGATRGAAIRLDEAGTVLGIGEGLETMLAVKAATGERCWACGSAGSLESVVLPSTVGTVHIWADNDRSGRGQKAAERAAARLHVEGRTVFIHVPPAAGTDWLDVYAADGPADLLAAETEDGPWRPARQTEALAGADGWEDPIPLDSPGCLPAFPAEAFPEPLRGFALEIAKGRQVPLDMPSLAMLGIVAAAAAGRFVVKLPTHEEPLNLYLLPALPPGTRKSQVVQDVAAPLYEVEREMVEAAKAFMAQEKAKRDVTEARIRYLRDQAAKTQDATKRDEIQIEIAALLAGLSEQASFPRLTCDDITPERLAALMAENNGAMALVSAEGGVVGMMAGRYQERGGPNLDVYLKGHSGDPLRVDRASDSASAQVRIIPRPALTLLLMVQPEVLSDLSRVPGARGRGLLARFLYSLPHCELGTRFYRDRPIDESLRLGYHAVIRNILHHPMPETPRPLRLDLDSIELWREFHDQVERRMAEGEDLHELADWASKMAGAVARIAGGLHVAANAAGRPEDLPISGETVRAAIDIGHYFVAHAKSAFALMVDPPEVRLARRILSWIERRQPGEFSIRDCYQAVRLNRPSDLNPGLQVLEEHGYVRRVNAQPQKGPGRTPGPRYRVNPAVGNHSQISQNGCPEDRPPDSVHFVNPPQGTESIDVLPVGHPVTEPGEIRG